jgi:hypothetical protein
VARLTLFELGYACSERWGRIAARERPFAPRRRLRRLRRLRALFAAVLFAPFARRGAEPHGGLLRARREGGLSSDEVCGNALSVRAAQRNTFTSGPAFTRRGVSLFSGHGSSDLPGGEAREKPLKARSARAPTAAELSRWQSGVFQHVKGLPLIAADGLCDGGDAPNQIIAKVRARLAFTRVHYVSP